MLNSPQLVYLANQICILKCKNRVKETFCANISAVAGRGRRTQHKGMVLEDVMDLLISIRAHKSYPCKRTMLQGANPCPQDQRRS